MAPAIDWPGLLRIGLLRLGLSPEAFWRLTPVELRMMLGEAAAVPSLTRARLEELAAAFPDRIKEASDDGHRGTAGPDLGA